MSDLEGKVALITGGGTGIGRGIARGFAREGMKLALAGLEHAPNADNQYGSRHLGGCSAAAAVAEAIGGDAFAIEGDVADAGAVDAMFARTVDRFGQVDVVVNAAGVDHRPPDRRDERGGVGQHHGRERQGDVPREPGRGAPDARPGRGRADHQHRVDRGQARRRDAHPLLRLEVRGRRLHECARQGGRARGHHGELHLPRHRGDADVDAAQRRLCRAGGDAGASLCAQHRATHPPGGSADGGRHGRARPLPRARAPMSPARPSTWTAAPSCSSRRPPRPPGIPLGRYGGWKEITRNPASRYGRRRSR